MTLAAIKPEAHLVQVSSKMLGADLVPCSDDAALQERERGFNGVRVNVGSKPNILPGAVVNGFVSDFSGSLSVSPQFVSNQDFHVLAEVLLNESRQRAALGISGMEETQITATLPDTDHDLFCVLSVLLPLPQLSATDIGFVHFNYSVQHRHLSLDHGATDAMAEIPCGFVADSEFALHLKCGVPLARFTDQQCSYKPLNQWQMRVIEDRASGYGELIITILAIEELLRRRQFRNFAVTAGAFRAIRPAQAVEQFAALFIGIKQVHHVNQRHKAPHE